LLILEKIIFIGVGSNLGDKRKNINRALELLTGSSEVIFTKRSSFYQTDPVGYKEQDWFLNMVVEIATSLTPWELLNRLMAIENEMGRQREIHWGPRIIDLDILLYGQLKINSPDLQVPHPRLEERAFVVVPLAEISPGLLLPSGRKVSDLADQLSKSQKICRSEY
jgi:2-amino-4-hydroxy-6-hydroxymethyldihydropteridine diphosphokinase